MQRALLFLLLSTLPAAATECGAFDQRTYRTMSDMLERLDPDIVYTLTDCFGEEMSHDGDTRHVVYQSSTGGILAISWRGDRAVGISQSGLQ